MVPPTAVPHKHLIVRVAVAHVVIVFVGGVANVDGLVHLVVLVIRRDQEGHTAVQTDRVKAMVLNIHKFMISWLT